MDMVQLQLLFFFLIKIQRLKGYRVKKLLYFYQISSKCDTHDHKQRDIYFLLWWNSVKLNRCSGKQTLNTCRFSVFITNSSKDTVSCLHFFVLLTSFLGLIFSSLPLSFSFPPFLLTHTFQSVWEPFVTPEQKKGPLVTIF